MNGYLYPMNCVQCLPVYHRNSHGETTVAQICLKRKVMLLCTCRNMSKCLSFKAFISIVQYKLTMTRTFRLKSQFLFYDDRVQPNSTLWNPDLGCFGSILWLQFMSIIFVTVLSIGQYVCYDIHRHNCALC